MLALSSTADTARLAGVVESTAAVVFLGTPYQGSPELSAIGEWASINLGVLGDKVVPDTSSLIGDPREHAETLQANHVQMGRFSSARDPNYIKVAGELISVYKSVENDAIQKNTNLASQVIPLDTTNKIPTDLHHQQDMVFQKLRFQNMGSRQ
ncbi:hypothetical protein ACHAPI_002702 [Fusarium lateritium]